MNSNTTYKTLNILIAFVWIINGLLCKVLNLVPRHQEIIERVLGNNDLRTITILIGVSEIIMAIWILSNYKSKINAIAQIVIVGTMNVIELVLAPDLLLWGNVNFLYALIFLIIVYYTNFKIKKKHVIVS